MKLKERTAKNVHTAFVEEAKANQRLQMFAEKAEEEDLPQIAHLFRAVAAAEAFTRGGILPCLSLSPTHRLT